MLENYLNSINVEQLPDDFMEPPKPDKQPEDLQQVDSASQIVSHGSSSTSTSTSTSTVSQMNSDGTTSSSFSTFTTTKTSVMESFTVNSVVNPETPTVRMSSFMPQDINSQFNYASSSSSINMHQYHPMTVHHPSDIPLYSIPNQGPPPPSSRHPRIYSVHQSNSHHLNTLAGLPKNHQTEVLYPINQSKLMDRRMNDIPMNRFSRIGMENRLPSPPEEPFTSFEPNKRIGQYTAQQLKAALQENLSSEEHIDTVKVCSDVSESLRKLRISQTIFAETIIARSQGTLSDILKNPRPFDDLKSGKETYRRMENWMKLDGETKRGLAVLTKEEMESLTGLKYNKGKRKKESNDDTEDQSSGKRSRIVFSGAQKMTLHNVFKYFKERPSMEEIEQVAAHLDLEYITVHNFFMNSRRRRNAGKPLSGDISTPFDPTMISRSESLAEFLERMSQTPNLPSFF